MKPYLNYLKGLFKHKYYVFNACMSLEVPFLLALFHDISKLSVTELFSYVKHFYNPDGSKKEVRDKNGAYDPRLQAKEFQKAWLHHQNNNKHHWGYWIILGDGGSVEPVEIPERYVREMIADWIGAGMAYTGKADPKGWYESQKHKMVFHPKTKELLEKLLNEQINN